MSSTSWRELYWLNIGIAFLVSLFIATLVGLVSYFNFITETRLENEQIDETIKLIEEHLTVFDFEAIQSIGELTAQKDFVKSLDIVSESGFRIYSSNGAKTQPGLASDSNSKKFDLLNDRSNDSVEQTVLGSLYIEISRNQSVFSESVQFAIISFLLCFALIAGLVIFYIRTFVISPLSDLFVAIDDTIRSGKPTEAKQKTRRLGYLADQFNRMQLHLNSVQRELLKESSTRFSAEQQAQLTARNLDSIIASIGEGIVAVDQNQRVTHYNDAALDILESDEQAILNLPFTELWDVREPENFSFDFFEDEQYQTIKIQLSEKTASVSLSQSKLQTEDGQTLGYVYVFRDISAELLQRENEFSREKLVTLGTFTGGVAHDFNNILSVVLGNTELAQQIPNPPERLERYLSKIVSATERGSQLTKRLLSYSRKAPVELNTIDLNIAVAETMEMATRLLPADITTSVDLNAEFAEISSDRSMIENAVLNLIINARDAMPENGLLSITTYNQTINENNQLPHLEDVNPGNYVVLVITDNGIGMSPQTLKRIFEPFYTTKAPGKGTGLGLSMIFGYMKQIGGLIDVNSYLGQGTSFTLYFPAGGSAPKTQGKTVTSTIENTDAFTVLAVDDNNELLAIVVELLLAEGFTVYSAADAKEAMATYQQHHDINLLLTDIRMPGEMNGIDLSYKLLKEDPNLGVIYMSGYAEEYLSDKSKLPRDCSIMMKPISRDALLTVIDEQLQKKVVE